jgi:hypothetical protein
MKDTISPELLYYAMVTLLFLLPQRNLILFCFE